MDFIHKNNIEAEESLIASLFLNNNEIDNCFDLMPEDFYKASHREIFKAIISIIGKKEIADLVSVGHFLKDNCVERWKEISIQMPKIVDCAPLSMNVEAHAKIIKDCALNRRILTTAMNIVDMCREKKKTSEILATAQSQFLQIEEKDICETVKKVSEIVHSHIDRIEEANTNKQGGGIPTGLPVIDRKLIVKDAKLIIIAGRPGMGKTSLALTMANNMDRIGAKPGILSIEMPESEIMDKLLAINSGIDSSKMDRYKGLNQKEYEMLSIGCDVLSHSNILLDSTGNLRFSQVAQRCRKMVKEGVEVIFIDQLSQIKGETPEEDRDRFGRYALNVNRIALLKKELGIPIFLLAQLNRKLEQRINKEPMLSDLKMSGDIEEDADSVLFLYRPGMYENTNELSEEERSMIESKTILNLAKNRKGGTVRTDRVLFNNKTQYFYEE